MHGTTATSARPRSTRRRGRRCVAALAILLASLLTVALAGTPAWAAATGKVNTGRIGPLNIRSAPGSTAAILGTVPSGATIAIACQTEGTTVSGTYGTTATWDKTTYNGKTGYVSDAYVYTGSMGYVAASCTAPSPPPTTSVPPAQSATSKAKAAAVIAKAKGMMNKGLTYAWGGGGKAGPSYGICCAPGGIDDRKRFGFDCSGLTEYAYWQGAGISIGTTSTAQSKIGKRIPWAYRQPGDLILWYNPGGATTYHVAIYIGNNQLIESSAPRNSNAVHIANVYGSHSTVVRVLP